MERLLGHDVRLLEETKLNGTGAMHKTWHVIFIDKNILTKSDISQEDAISKALKILENLS